MKIGANPFCTYVNRAFLEPPFALCRQFTYLRSTLFDSFPCNTLYLHHAGSSPSYRSWQSCSCVRNATTNCKKYLCHHPSSQPCRPTTYPFTVAPAVPNSKLCYFWTDSPQSDHRLLSDIQLHGFIFQRHKCTDCQLEFPQLFYIGFPGLDGTL